MILHKIRFFGGMSNAARMKIVPHPGPSAFGYNVDGYSLSEELGGAMIKLALSTGQGEVEIRCTHEWAIRFSEKLRKYAKTSAQTCNREGINLFQATE